MMKLRIRGMQICDYEGVVALWEAAELPYRPLGRDRKEAIEGELAGSCSVFLVAERDGCIVGVVLGTHDGRKGWVNRLAVHPDVQRQGIGRRLVQELEERFRTLGIGIVTCLIEGGNARSEAFFRGLGYVQHEEITYYAKRFDPDV